jgi:ABC-type phosphate transport system substrate-binding protein
VKLPVVKQSDDEVMTTVAGTPGAVGYVSGEAALPSSVKAVAIVE